jgi:tRNA pseudouridine38-40 synthase
MLQTFLAVLHFDGGGFIGWQRQSSGRSVQGEVEQVLGRLTGQRVVAHAAGRTDTGVHAQGLGISFSLPLHWSAGGRRPSPMSTIVPTSMRTM